jgi:hypothetical protein
MASKIQKLPCGFIECTSLTFSYDIMGRVTVSYTSVHKDPDFCFVKELDAGGQTFTGEVLSMSMNQIIGTVGWYETHVTLVATTN